MIRMSLEQVPVYVVVKKRYIPNEEDEKPSELDLPEYHYILDDRQIPVIGDDNKYLYKNGSPWCTTDAPELAEKFIFQTKEETDKFKKQTVVEL